jgi:hypothetical protein
MQMDQCPSSGFEAARSKSNRRFLDSRWSLGMTVGDRGDSGNISRLTVSFQVEARPRKSNRRFLDSRWSLGMTVVVS